MLETCQELSSFRGGAGPSHGCWFEEFQIDELGEARVYLREFVQRIAERLKPGGSRAGDFLVGDQVRPSRGQRGCKVRDSTAGRNATRRVIAEARLVAYH